MTDDEIVECKPTPHPDAVAAGTCPAPSPEHPDTGVSPDDGEDTVGDQPTTMVPGVDDAPSLPVTGAPVGAMVALGMTFLIVAAVIIIVARHRSRKREY